MRGQAESLNVAMAGAVLMYEAMRQRYFDPGRR
jgi:TrmH family RNA methyltransferase